MTRHRVRHEGQRRDHEVSLYHRAVRTDSTAMPRGGAVADGTSKADREGRQQKSEMKRLDDEEWKTFWCYAQAPQGARDIFARTVS